MTSPVTSPGAPPAPGEGHTPGGSAVGKQQALPVPRVYGLDLSLTSTGLAGNGWTERLRPPTSLKGLPRLRWIRDNVLDRCCHAELVVVEALIPSRVPNSYSLERAGLWWLVADVLRARGIRVVPVNPSTLKKYATGKGKAGKDEVLTAALRRIPGFDGNNDEADAAWLCAIGLDHVGVPALVPESHRAALTVIHWQESL